jgi:hypothetical protein
VSRAEKMRAGAPSREDRSTLDGKKEAVRARCAAKWESQSQEVSNCSGVERLVVCAKGAERERAVGG